MADVASQQESLVGDINDLKQISTLSSEDYKLSPQSVKNMLELLCDESVSNFIMYTVF